MHTRSLQESARTTAASSSSASKTWKRASSLVLRKAGRCGKRGGLFGTSYHQLNPTYFLWSLMIDDHWYCIHWFKSIQINYNPNPSMDPSNSLVLVKSLYFCGPGSGANSEIESFTQACEFGSLGSPQAPASCGSCANRLRTGKSPSLIGKSTISMVHFPKQTVTRR